VNAAAKGGVVAHGQAAELGTARDDELSDQQERARSSQGPRGMSSAAARAARRVISSPEQCESVAASGTWWRTLGLDDGMFLRRGRMNVARKTLRCLERGHGRGSVSSASARFMRMRWLPAAPRAGPLRRSFDRKHTPATVSMPFEGTLVATGGAKHRPKVRADRGWAPRASARAGSGPSPHEHVGRRQLGGCLDAPAGTAEATAI
jgi:hypothetical protein